jgi:hypothetical protein
MNPDPGTILNVGDLVHVAPDLKRIIVRRTLDVRWFMSEEVFTVDQGAIGLIIKVIHFQSVGQVWYRVSYPQGVGWVSGDDVEAET